MSNQDPAVVFEELTDEVNEFEADADCGEVPVELIELSMELEKNDTSPEDFLKAFGPKAKKAAKKRG